MTISTRTPEGDSYLCRICGEVVVAETSNPPGDSVCPRCGSILWETQQIIADRVHVPPDEASAVLGEFQSDSLDLVELVMEFESRFGLTIPDADYDQFRTIEDVVRYRYIRRKLDEGEPG